MHLLVVVATERERAWWPSPPPASPHTIDILVTGVGMVATAVHVARALTRAPYDLALNVGVCGAFDRSLALGAVVHVTSDRLAELGVEDGPRFLPAEAVGLSDPDEAPWTGGQLINPAPPATAVLDALPTVRGITVNTVHGDEASIAEVVGRCQPQVESMEGAAFMYACLTARVPFAQIRAVSNYVERRDRAVWRLSEAIDAIGRTTTALLRELPTKSFSP
jgi:futalosine hydrolase